MTLKYLIDEQAIEKIKKQGCCLGKYRVHLSDGYYCFLERIFDCSHQNRKYVKNINAYMFVCRTNQQRPCEQCDVYKKSNTILAEKEQI